MQKPVFGHNNAASARDVAAQLVRNEFSGMPVAERDGTVVGIVTKADILRAFAKGKALEDADCQRYHDGKPASVDTETPITDVIRLFRSTGFCGCGVNASTWSGSSPQRHHPGCSGARIHGVLKGCIRPRRGAAKARRRPLANTLELEILLRTVKSW